MRIWPTPQIPTNAFRAMRDRRPALPPPLERRSRRNEGATELASGQQLRNRPSGDCPGRLVLYQAGAAIVEGEMALHFSRVDSPDNLEIGAQAAAAILS